MRGGEKRVKGVERRGGTVVFSDITSYIPAY